MTLRILHTVGDDELARVFVAETDDGSRVEFVESIQPPHPREEKWVLIVSTLKGCPIGCPICDAGGSFRGQLTSDEFFVSESAAREGVVIANPSATDPIVMLKHFGPGNPDLTLKS